MSPYQRRNLEQLEAWVSGTPRHNHTDGGCCPDFSCCSPGLYTHDREARLQTLNARRARLGLGPRLDA